MRREKKRGEREEQREKGREERRDRGRDREPISTDMRMAGQL